MPYARRTGAYSAVAVLGLLGGLLGPGGLGGLLGGSSGSGGQTSAQPTAAQWQKMGGTYSKWKRVLRKGCHDYAYTYNARPPAAAGTEWGLETFLLGPRRGHLASDVILGGANAKHGTRTFRICRSSTMPGKFTIKTKLSYKEEPDQYAGWVRTSHFRLVKP